mmetsp:Transcript_4742/g.6864  ORF Transcript_4742/g.6864 Transcript_4742/m.6864 type:complete len:306 (+) Transcript_4742:38-955(+)|eukprot:CAMPEP_0194214744 /NCGR_PEP_ID=MMETSP0156-20130528/16086_1 /TAXON_ID=33649 /ORGANISM="Thalassionema nitzschioides, Strain L26-B" /LENGTH=305 /DNA_ID=CAMNT_0038943075 /DNA_START=61 /DNA_END=978 /DNA_ORIENTATION=-
MKLSVSAFLLSLAATAVADDVVVLDEELSSDWEMFDPNGHGELMDDNKCHLTSGDSIFANLDYVEGVGVQAKDESDLFKPPAYGGDARWLVVDIVVPNDKGKCPNKGDKSQCLKSNLSFQFYGEERQRASMPIYPALFNDSDNMGKISSSDGKHSICVRIPLNCRDNAEFPGWKGFMVENFPLAKEQCQGPLEFHVDSIKISTECPIEEELEMECSAGLNTKKRNRRLKKSGASTKVAKGTKKGGKTGKKGGAQMWWNEFEQGLDINGNPMEDDDFEFGNFCRRDDRRRLEDDGDDFEYRGVCGP